MPQRSVSVFISNVSAALFAVVAVNASTASTADGQVAALERAPGLERPGGELELRLEVQLERAVWGQWEHPAVDVRLLNALDFPIEVFDGDASRGMTGKLLYLKGPDGEVMVAGRTLGGRDLPPPRFARNGVLVEPKAAAESWKHLRLTRQFGRLKPGSYSLQVVIPEGRWQVNGTTAVKLASVPTKFQVAPMTESLRKQMLKPPPESTGAGSKVQLRTASSITTDVLRNGVRLSLTNGGDVPIEYMRDDGAGVCATRCESFGGDGKWHDCSLAWCKLGSAPQSLKPNGKQEIETYVESSAGQYIRFRLAVWSANSNGRQRRDVVSNVVHVVKSQR